MDYDKVNVVISELGFGYNAAMAVEGGRLADNVGGIVASVGTLTVSALDLEVVSYTSSWKR